MSASHGDITGLIAAARGEKPETIDGLLELYRNYLT